MRLSVLSSEEIPVSLLQHLQALGYHLQIERFDRIRALDNTSLDVVHIVSSSEFTTEDWPENRVKLARASRFYLVYGEGLNTRQIVDAVRDGAHDVVDLLESRERWKQAIDSAAQAQDLWWQLYGAQGEVDDRKMVGRSKAMQTLRDQIQRIGPTDATVLIMGESGTGKELVAESIHEASGRAPFVTVNCAAIPAELMESELFGAEKGAFTGASRNKPGLVEEAAGGTLFLDEIGELGLSLQPKLLRFLETRRARRVGSTKEYVSEVRVVSATNRDLQAESQKGEFRLDLFYRLSEVVLNSTPLRDRPEDIPDLSLLFLEKAAVRLGKNFESMEPELTFRMQGYSWPGNVRELRQTIERMAIYYDGPVMRSTWWNEPKPPEDTAPKPSTMVSVSHERRSTADPFHGSSHSPFPRRALNKREKFEYARRLMEESGGDLSWTASQLGIHPTTLYRWRKEGKV
ncbi:sigma-54 dependent transcriptional regulator [Cerasicoccus maritimus]|uniref:sigma-54 dependent transcriptional regulator n=1 Tax=Cerasicoccus maritimus TaxID=490089 RepID=UPI0028525DF6|nr:sigma-54 dependent transcriptional regulator [Cerasicoccus maritimus]